MQNCSSPSLVVCFGSAAWFAAVLPADILHDIVTVSLRCVCQLPAPRPPTTNPLQSQGIVVLCYVSTESQIA